MEFAEVLMTRRAVRRFREGGVDREVIERIARQAQRTPSAGFSQDIPDEFVPIGVMPVGLSLPDVRSPSLKRGWVPFEAFARFEGWG